MTGFRVVGQCPHCGEWVEVNRDVEVGDKSAQAAGVNAPAFLLLPHDCVPDAPSALVASSGLRVLAKGERVPAGQVKLRVMGVDVPAGLTDDGRFWAEHRAERVTADSYAQLKKEMEVVVGRDLQSDCKLYLGLDRGRVWISLFWSPDGDLYDHRFLTRGLIGEGAPAVPPYPHLAPRRQIQHEVDGAILECSGDYEARLEALSGLVRAIEGADEPDDVCEWWSEIKRRAAAIGEVE